MLRRSIELGMRWVRLGLEKSNSTVHHRHRRRRQRYYVNSY